MSGLDDIMWSNDNEGKLTDDLARFSIVQVSLALLDVHCRSRDEALKIVGASGLLEALLPEEFIADFAPKIRATPDWLGFWILLDGKVFGSGGYRLAPVNGVTEIGYGIHPDRWGGGAATALCQRLVSHAFEYGALIVRAHTLHEGFASQKVLTRNGFRYVGDSDEPDDGVVMRWERHRSEAGV